MRIELFAILTPVFVTAALGGGLQIRVVSGRADMVSGGSALVEAHGPGDAPLTAMLNGRDVSSAFRRGRESGSLLGRVEGLANGKNRLQIGAARLDLLNHPITGPIFSGPHQKPFVCQTEAAGLGPPLDADCSVKTTLAYFYKSTQPPPAPRRLFLVERCPQGSSLLTWRIDRRISRKQQQRKETLSITSFAAK